MFTALVHGSLCQIDPGSDPAALDPPLLLKYTSAANIHFQTPCDRHHLVDELSVERNADRGQKQTCILIGCGGGVDDDVATGDLLGRVPDVLSVFHGHRALSAEIFITHMS